MQNRESFGDRLSAAIPEIVESYGRNLRRAANPLGTTPELWDESRSHAALMLRACAAAIDCGTDDRDPGEDLLACSAMGSLWACCRARLTDSLGAMETLLRITLDTAVALAEDVAVEDRSALITRAARVINEVGSQHTRTAALSYDAYLLQQIEQANSEDRMRLARDIHDRLGNSLVLALRHLELYRSRTGAIAKDRHLAAIQASLDEATGFTRGLVSGLRAEAPLSGLSEALTACTRTLNLRDLPVLISIHGDETWLSAHERDELFLIVREFLRNSFAHADPSSVSVRVGISPHRVDVEAHDDGRGFSRETGPGSAATERHPTDVHGQVGGSGLVVMQERTEQLGGQFVLHTRPGKGTRMRLWVPLQRGMRGPGAPQASDTPGGRATRPVGV